MQEILFDANTRLEVYLGIPLHTLGECASTVSPACIITEATIHVIKDIRLIQELPMLS